MVYLEEFHLLTGEGCRELSADIQRYQTQDEYYPAYVFSEIELEQIHFEDITIFYGGNGSGKTSLLNVIAEKLGVQRKKEYIKTDFFAFYLECCKAETSGEYRYIQRNNKFLASDDIFDAILSVREENKKIKQRKNEERLFHEDVREGSRGYRHFYPEGIRLNFEKPGVGKEIDSLRSFSEAQKKTRRQYVRSRAGEMQRQYSNGENALMFFDEQIQSNAVYLLDEPENSLSPKFQLELKTLIEDSVRYNNCQFIIATHSPFMLSLPYAKIYNLDATPVSVERWQDLENVRYYYELFQENRELFE